jgi:hypothetical protein
MYNASEALKKREIYLFNDMVIVTKLEGEKHKLLNMCALKVTRRAEIQKPTLRS